MLLRRSGLCFVCFIVEVCGDFVFLLGFCLFSFVVVVLFFALIGIDVLCVSCVVFYSFYFYLFFSSLFLDGVMVGPFVFVSVCARVSYVAILKSFSFV